MTVKRRINPPQFNPFVNPTVLPNGRVFIPTHAPVYLTDNEELEINPYERRRIGFLDSAQFFVGRKVNLPTSKRYKVGSKVPVQDIQDTFNKLRGLQIGRKKVGVTVISQRGLYKGQPENSIQIIVFYSPSEKEPSFRAFEKNMLYIAEDIADIFGQESIIVNFYKKGLPFRAYDVAFVK